MIGEGLIQLRGPIRGINKIRTMINRIDTPVGQVKVGIMTIQVNGEHGDRMDKVAARIEGQIDISRYLTSQSLMLLRRSIQEVAGAVHAAVQSEYPGGHMQADRDRKYLYSFFGRDFIDELYEMDSEFLRTENKLLSLHSMDTVSLPQALFIMSLAKNDIRQHILQRFMTLVECQLPQIEWDFRVASRLLPRHANKYEEVVERVLERYRFRNLRSFYDVEVAHADAMTPMQREFIRLAQIFKSQMLAELEYKQRVIERGLIQDRANDEDEVNALLDGVRRKAQLKVRDALDALGDDQEKFVVELSEASTEAYQHLHVADAVHDDLNKVVRKIDGIILNSKVPRGMFATTAIPMSTVAELRTLEGDLKKVFATLNTWTAYLTADQLTKLEKAKSEYSALLSRNNVTYEDLRRYAILHGKSALDEISKVTSVFENIRKVIDLVIAFRNAVVERTDDLEKVRQTYNDLAVGVNVLFSDVNERPVEITNIFSSAKLMLNKVESAELRIQQARKFQRRVRRDLDHRKLLDFLIDEQEEKYIELKEGTLSHISHFDNHLKRLAIAMEDDFKVQFYDPAFEGIRMAAREWDVTLGQVERTTILTNNRAYAKVSPSATFEFDLPKRDILIQEAMVSAQALVQDYGALLQDPTFLAASQLFSGSPTTFTSTSGVDRLTGMAGQGQASPAVKSSLPSFASADEQILSQSPTGRGRLGSALESLIPDPAIYKFETGTGFEIRPVIQPDGQSVIRINLAADALMHRCHSATFSNSQISGTARRFRKHSSGPSSRALSVVSRMGISIRVVVGRAARHAMR